MASCAPVSLELCPRTQRRPETTGIYFTSADLLLPTWRRAPGAAWNGRENPSSRGALLFSFFWDNALSDSDDVWSHPFQATDPLGTPYGLNTASSSVQQSFGSALEQMNASGFPYDIALAQVQYVTLDGQNIPLPGGPADPNGELLSLIHI